MHRACDASRFEITFMHTHVGIHTQIHTEKRKKVTCIDMLVDI
jgi:hypothetical protein